jgi:flagellar motor switch protein FliM
MDKILSQQEIDAMFRNAHKGASAPSPAAAIARWDYRQAGRLGREQIASISILHQGFARSLTYSIGALLRTAFNVALMSAEHLAFSDFLGGIPEVTYLASCKLSPYDAWGLIQLDLDIAYAIVDVLLGGEGSGTSPAREVTEIEEQVLEAAMRIVCRELQAAWQTLSLEFQFGDRQKAGKAQQLMALEEKMLCLSFEVVFKERRGTMSIAVPTVISSLLLRKLSVARPRFYSRPDSQDFTRQLRKLLLNCPFRFELTLEAAASSAQLTDLRPGKVLVLNRGAGEPAALFAEGRAIYKAHLARRGSRRVAQIISSFEQEKNAQ